MLATSTPYPSFSWSHSRDRTLHHCVRRYYWRYYGAHNGWATGAAPDAALAYRLRRLITLPAALGIEIHARAREIASAIRARRVRPSLEVLRARTRTALNALWRSSGDGTAFGAPSRQALGLLERYYGRGPSHEALAQTAERLERCLATLVSCPLWGELAALAPADVLVFEEPATFDLDEVRVYAAPDLAYRARGDWTIVDWKTGSAAGVAEQLEVYALALVHGRGILPGPHGWAGRVIDLADGTDTWYDLTEQDLAAAVERIRAGVVHMRSYLDDVAVNRPRPKHAFPFTTHRALCQYCAFLEACQGEPDFEPRSDGVQAGSSDELA